MIIVKKKNGCMPCEQLTRWMCENSIQLETKYVEDEMSYCLSIGIRSMPSLVLDDGTIIPTFEKVKEYLQKELLDK